MFDQAFPSPNLKCMIVTVHLHLNFSLIQNWTNITSQFPFNISLEIQNKIFFWLNRIIQIGKHLSNMKIKFKNKVFDTNKQVLYIYTTILSLCFLHVYVHLYIYTTILSFCFLPVYVHLQIQTGIYNLRFCRFQQYRQTFYK